MVRNLPGDKDGKETWVQCLSGKDPLEKGKKEKQAAEYEMVR